MIGFLSQSGGLGTAVIEAASRRGIGLSSFVSVGNKADLSGNDFLQYWAQDPRTEVVLLCLESFGNPRKFARITRRLSGHKPVIAAKGGRTPTGRLARRSPTGATLSASEVTVDALFEQAGVIRTETLAEMFDVAAVLSMQPVPAGDRIAIVTNAGAPGIVCADACRAAGARVPEITGELAGRLSPGPARGASVANPVDMIATATADQYRTMLEALTRSGQFDAVLAICAAPQLTPAADVAAAIHEVSAQSSRCTLAAVFMTAEGPPPELAGGGVSVPGFRFPEDAARAIARAARHGQRRGRAVGEVRQTSGPAVAHGASIISHELTQNADWMAARSVAALLDCHGIPRAPRLLPAAAAGREASASPAQPMISGSAELRIGVIQDPDFGPLLACGAGGPNAELPSDTTVRITPVTDIDAKEMLAGLRSFKLLTGYGGAAPCDLDAIYDVIMRVSAMVEAHPEIVELDCDPVIVGPAGATVAGARIRLRRAPVSLPTPAIGR